MNERRIGLLAFLVGIVGIILEVGPSYVLEQWLADGLRFPAGVPTFETVGTTVVIYRQLIDIIGPSMTVVLGMLLGYYAGTHLDVGREFRRFVGAVVFGSTTPIVVGIVATIGFGLGTSTTVSLASALIFVGLILSTVVAVPLLVVLGAIAGLSVAHLNESSRIPRSSADAGITSAREDRNDSDIPNDGNQTQSAD